MKIKKIVDLCRRNGVAQIYKDKTDTQWLGDGYALYPLYGIPKLNEDEFFTTFDFTAKQRNKMLFAERKFPEVYCSSDFCADEERCQEHTLKIPFGSRLLIPYTTRDGIKFLDSAYVAPFEGEDSEIEVYERKSESGEMYFAIKVGMILRAIVMPFNAINESFVDKIKEIYLLCEVSLQNKNNGMPMAKQLGVFDDKNSEEE